MQTLDSRIYYCANAADYTASLKTALYRSVYKFIAQTRICRFLTDSFCVNVAQSR